MHAQEHRIVLLHSGSCLQLSCFETHHWRAVHGWQMCNCVPAGRAAAQLTAAARCPAWPASSRLAPPGFAPRARGPASHACAACRHARGQRELLGGANLAKQAAASPAAGRGGQGHGSGTRLSHGRHESQAGRPAAGGAPPLTCQCGTPPTQLRPRAAGSSAPCPTHRKVGRSTGDCSSAPPPSPPGVAAGSPVAAPAAASTRPAPAAAAWRYGVKGVRLRDKAMAGGWVWQQVLHVAGGCWLPAREQAPARKAPPPHPRKSRSILIRLPRDGATPAGPRPSPHLLARLGPEQGRVAGAGHLELLAVVGAPSIPGAGHVVAAGFGCVCVGLVLVVVV